jgi:hypothetical protein
MTAQGRGRDGQVGGGGFTGSGTSPSVPPTLGGSGPVWTAGTSLQWLVEVGLGDCGCWVYRHRK